MSTLERPLPAPASNQLFGSDAVAETLRALDVPFIALNPGSSFRGLHDSLVNHLGNERPQMLLCLHEEHAVAIAQGYAPGGSLSCVSGGSGSTGCLQVTNLIDPTKQRAVLVLAGRSLSSLAQTRPSSSLQDYLDSTENRNGDSIFVQSPVGRSFNDRFISVSKNP